MEWNGRSFRSYPEIIDYALALPTEEQTLFVKAYGNSSPHALSNVGYFAGYFDRAKKHEIFRVFQTSHPIFGTRDPSPEEAFDMGERMGKEQLKRELESD